MQIFTCEELILTEMIFENILANLEPEEVVAVLSALVFQVGHAAARLTAIPHMALSVALSTFWLLLFRCSPVFSLSLPYLTPTSALPINLEL